MRKNAAKNQAGRTRPKTRFHWGYVGDVVVEGDAKKKIKIRLKYNGKKNVIEGLKRISKPGLRKYVGATEIPRVLGGLGVSIVSTSEGVMTGTQAKKKKSGRRIALLHLVTI